MPRKYVKKLGREGKRNYNLIYLENALKDVKAGKLSMRKASEQYGVPYSTLNEHYHEKHKLKYGGQTILSAEEEKYLSNGIQKCGEWGYPLTRWDIRLLVQNYLNSFGKKVKNFPNNLPGLEWFKGFLKRHNELSERMAQNIKRARAAVTKDVIKNYFKELEISLIDVCASNIINFDETNFCDDPGSSKVVVKRGSRHPEKLIDSSKTSISVMFAAAADGTILPPYTVYKSKHLYPSWIENGVIGAGYNRNISGWFDIEMFEDWFSKIIIPYVRKLQGPVVLIGDNLSSHLSLNVIKICEEKRIKFIFLPPNSTHICQPLDIAFFRPLKRAWRKILEGWKIKNSGVLPKAMFPTLLRKTFEMIGMNSAKNIISGFKAAGIYPFNCDIVLKKLPDSNDDLNTSADDKWTAAFSQHLEKFRMNPNSNKKTFRGKRLSVPAGKGITVEDLSGNVTDIREPSCPTPYEEQEEGSACSSDIRTHATEKLNYAAFSVGDFVLVKFPFEDSKNHRLYVGKILKVFSNGEKFSISYLRKKVGLKQVYLHFPEELDIQTTKKSELVKKIIVRDLRRERFQILNHDVDSIC